MNQKINLSKINELIASKEKLGDKRKELKKILLKLIKNIVIFENIKFDILDYVRPNRREVCYKVQNVMINCKSVSGKCMLLVNKENLITHKSNKETYISI